MNDRKWIQSVHAKVGAFSRQVGVPVNKNIPKVLLTRIIKARPGEVVVNPSSIGKPRIKVTRLLERRANFALNVKNIRRSK